MKFVEPIEATKVKIDYPTLGQLENGQAFYFFYDFQIGDRKIYLKSISYNKINNYLYYTNLQTGITYEDPNEYAKVIPVDIRMILPENIG
jgi:hypothetical protein